jgi:hypothetical protein
MADDAHGVAPQLAALRVAAGQTAASLAIVGAEAGVSCGQAAGIGG